MTLDQLVQALSSASADAREVLNKIKDIATVNGDVNITFYDGTTITLPGLPKLNSQFQQFMINNENIIKSWWNKAFYVDAENGDDNNPGTQDAPFKTIKKACDSVPIGGIGYIKLTPGQIYTISSPILIKHKVIHIYGHSYYNNIIEADDKLNSGSAIIQIDPVNEKHRYFVGTGEIAFFTVHIKQLSVHSDPTYCLTVSRNARARGCVFEAPPNAHLWYTFNYDIAGGWQEEYLYLYCTDPNGNASVVKTGHRPYTKVVVNRQILQGNWTDSPSLD